MAAVSSTPPSALELAIGQFESLLKDLTTSTFGAYLKRLRKKKELTLKQVERAAHVSMPIFHR